MLTQSSVQINMSGTQLSDLFFNHEHPKREALMKRYANEKVGPTPYELEEAALADATEFMTLYNIPVQAEELAKDFLARV